MHRIRLNLRGACLGAFAFILAIAGARAAEVDATAGKVGELGRAGNLLIEGSSRFSAGGIASQLQSKLEFYARSDPDAPMDEYLAWLEKAIRQGYQYKGFHQATVAARADLEARKIRVRVTEGAQYSWGA